MPTTQDCAASTPGQARPSAASLLARRFRASPVYSLQAWDALPAALRTELGRMLGQPAPYVLLPPPASGLHVKAIDDQAAGLLADLGAKGLLPASFPRDEYGCRRLQQLVLDQVLEVEIEGRFVSGPESAAHLLTAVRDEADHPLAQLATQALQYAQALPLDDPRQLSARLYWFGTLPLGPRWTRSLPDERAVLQALGLGPGSALHDSIAEHFDAVASPHWLAWRYREQPATLRSRYKLYVSVQPPDLFAVLPAVVDVLARHGAPFKVGKDLRGLLRPDKLVAYFEQLPVLRRAAAELESALHGCHTHGVPFTAPLDPRGMLSFGSDPPAAEQFPGWAEGESWRLWVTNRLALALVQAKHAGTSIEPSQYARLRLQAEGLDTRTWSVEARTWDAEDLDNARNETTAGDTGA